MSQEQIETLVEHGEEHGCVNLTELHELLQVLELEDEDTEALLARLEARGIDVTDDCSRAPRGGSRLHERRRWRAPPPTRCSCS